MRCQHDEWQLFSALLERDPRAQEEAVECFLADLLSLLARRFDLSMQDAEDIAFDVLADLLTDPEYFDPMRGVRLRTWLFRVASNRAIDLLRKQARLRESELRPNMVMVAAGGSYTNDWSATARRVQSICAQLPDEQQQILWWYAYGVTQSTIAAWLGKSDAAVRQTVSRLKRRVATQLFVRAQELPVGQLGILKAELAADARATGSPTDEDEHPVLGGRAQAGAKRLGVQPSARGLLGPRHQRDHR